MPASGEGPRRTTSLEEVVISTSLTNDGVVDPDTRRRGQHSTEPLLTGSSPQQQGHWFRHKARQSHTGSEYDPDEQAVPETSQETQQTNGAHAYPIATHSLLCKLATLLQCMLFLNAVQRHQMHLVVHC